MIVTSALLDLIRSSTYFLHPLRGWSAFLLLHGTAIAQTRATQAAPGITPNSTRNGSNHSVLMAILKRTDFFATYIQQQPVVFLATLNAPVYKKELYIRCRGTGQSKDYVIYKNKTLVCIYNCIVENTQRTTLITINPE